MSFQRKITLRTIYKIAFLEAMALSLVVPSVTSSGELPGILGCNNPATTIQCGTASCTVSLVACTLTINFSPAFASIPTIFQPTITTISPVNPSTTTSGFNIQPIPQFVFSTAPQTWTTMPTTDSPTEIFGTTNNRLQVDMPLTATSFIWNFCVTVITASINATATIGVQTSNNQATWIDLGDSAFRVNISTVSNGLSCVFETILSPTSFENFRLVGRDGFGVGDNPQFGNIFLYIQLISTQGIQVGNTPFTQVNTKTASAVSLQIVFPKIVLAAETVTIVWKAIL